MEETIKIPFFWHGMSSQIEAYTKTCHECQISKKNRKKYGKLPAKTAEQIPWQRVNVDLVVPYTITTPKKKHELRAMTMIDPVTGWFEIAPITNPDSNTTQRMFDSYWLARYPN